MGEQLGTIVAPALGSLQPFRRALVSSSSVGPSDLRVGDVTDQRVVERELDLSFGYRAARTMQQLFALELAQEPLSVVRVAVRHCGDRAHPRDPPDNGRVLHEALLVGRKG